MTRRMTRRGIDGTSQGRGIRRRNCCLWRNGNLGSHRWGCGRRINRLCENGSFLDLGRWSQRHGMGRWDRRCDWVSCLGASGLWLRLGRCRSLNFWNAKDMTALRAACLAARHIIFDAEPGLAQIATAEDRHGGWRELRTGGEAHAISF